MSGIPNRRTFIKQASFLLAASRARYVWAADGDSAAADTSSGKVRGTVVGDIKVFKGIPYGGNTTGKNRFMPPTKPVAWTGTRDALAFGPTAPQGTTGVARAGAPVENEDCLVLNVFTPSLTNGARRPVMVWLHGGGFATGSGSTPILDGTSLAHSGDVVVVTINHRLNVFGFTYLGEQAGPDFSLSGGVGMLDIVAALEWVRDNISRFGGDPNLVTIFGQSGGGRKVATLMSMPVAQGLYHRAIIESGAVLRLTTKEEAIRYSELLLAELGLKSNQARELLNVPVEKLLAANAEVEKKLPPRRAGYGCQFADSGRRRQPFESPLGSEGTGDFRPDPAADRIRPNRGNVVRPPHAGDAGPGRGGASERRRPVSRWMIPAP